VGPFAVESAARSANLLMATKIELLFCVVALALIWPDATELFIAWYSGADLPLQSAEVQRMALRIGSLGLAMLAVLATRFVRCAW